MNKLNVIITGATGMIGEGVLYECINHQAIDKILVITRNPTGYKHPMLTEIIHQDLSDISSLAGQLKDYQACYFCMGVTSVGKSEADYTRLTHTLALNFARTLASINANMTFCYVSGAGTDSSERGKRMWARVKGKTENDLMKLPFKQVYNFRPGGIEPFLPLRPSQTYYKTYKYLKWLFKLLKAVNPGFMVTLKELAAAMINSSLVGYPKNILEIDDVKILAKENPLK